MQNPNELKEPDSNEPSINVTFRAALILYSVLAAISVAGIYFLTDVPPVQTLLTGDYSAALSPYYTDLTNTQKSFIATAALSSLLILTSQIFKENFRSCRVNRKLLTQMLRSLGSRQMIGLCLIAAVSEELFFRLFLINTTDIVFATTLYVIMNTGPVGFLKAPTVENLVVGSFLGYAYMHTESVLVVALSSFIYKYFWLRSAGGFERKPLSLEDPSRQNENAPKKTGGLS